MSVRRYLTIIQDARGYPASGDGLDPAPPEGPEPPMLHQVVLADDHDAEVARLREENERLRRVVRALDEAVDYDASPHLLKLVADLELEEHDGR